MPGVTVKDLDQHVVTKVLAAFLKKSGKLVVPVQAEFIKTGKFKETAPTENDWFYTRCASIMRHLYIRSPSGVAAFTKVYGGRKRNGTHPSRYCRSADGCIRKVLHRFHNQGRINLYSYYPQALQALEAARMVEKHPDGGRKLTSKGQRDMDRIANQIVVKQRGVNKEPCVIIT
ncbi:hypothetical protein KR038_005896 [Drosophila bunnanda]|nr:hypothetical protein KR038_005896 [Drosophila bunnanda]